MDFTFEDNAAVEGDEDAFHTRVPEQFRAFYQKTDQGFTLREDMAAPAKVYDGLRGSLRKSRKEAEDFKKRAKQIDQWSDLGSPEEVRAKLAEAEARALKGATNKVDLEKMQAELKAHYEGKLTEASEQVKRINATLESHLVEAVAVAALAKQGITDPTLLMPHIRNRVRVQEGEDGKHVVRVLDEEGAVRGSLAGGFMTIPELVAQMSDDPRFRAAFPPRGTSGSGAPPAAPGGSALTQRGVPRSAMQKLEAGLKARSQHRT